MLDLSVTLKHYTSMLPLLGVAGEGFLVNFHTVASILWQDSSIQLSSFGPRQTKSTLRLSYSKRQLWSASVQCSPEVRLAPPV